MSDKWLAEYFAEKTERDRLANLPMYARRWTAVSEELDIIMGNSQPQKPSRIVPVLREYVPVILISFVFRALFQWLSGSVAVGWVGSMAAVAIFAITRKPANLGEGRGVDVESIGTARRR